MIKPSNYVQITLNITLRKVSINLIIGNSLCNFGQYDLAITMYDKAINNKP